MYDNIYNNVNGYFGRISSDGETENDYGRGFSIDKIIRDIEDNTYTLELSTLYLGQRVTTNLPRGHLDKKYIGELQSKGFDINPTNFDTFMKALQNVEEEYIQNATVAYNSHKYVGWQEVEIDGDKKLRYKSYSAAGEFKSEYTGVLDIKPQGTLENQLDMIRSEVEGNTPMEAILVIGASSIIIGFIGNLINVPTPVVHLYGDSTQGKTTAAQLAVSISGSPNLHKSGLFMSWHGTDNSIITRLKGNYGMPVAFDELSKYQGKNLSTLVYSLSDGREKDRNDKEGNIKQIGEFDGWHTTIISTGEASLIGKCRNNTGLKMRVIELDDVFTTSAKNAEAIKESVSNNYGYIAPKLARMVSRCGQDKLIKKHEKYKKKIVELCEGVPLIERTANTYAVFVLSAWLLNNVFNLRLHIDNIMQYFVDKIKNNETNVDMAEVALEKIIEFVSIHSSNFIQVRKEFPSNRKQEIVRNCGEENSQRAYECYGKVEHFSQDKNIAMSIIIIYSKADDIFKQLGFEDTTVVLNKLKAKGYLEHEEGKLYRKRKINDSDTKSKSAVVINIPRDKEDTGESKQPTNAETSFADNQHELTLQEIQDYNNEYGSVILDEDDSDEL